MICQRPNDWNWERKLFTRADRPVLFDPVFPIFPVFHYFMGSPTANIPPSGVTSMPGPLGQGSLFGTFMNYFFLAIAF